MKIMMLNDFWKFSGGEQIFCWLIEELRVLGHDVLGLTHDELKKKGLDQYLGEFNPDIIHQHNFAHIGPVALRHMKKRPSVQTVHDYWPICPDRHHYRFDLDQICDTPADCIKCPCYLGRIPYPSSSLNDMEGIKMVGVSQYVAERISEFGYEGVEFIRNGIRLHPDIEDSSDEEFILGMGSLPDQVKGLKEFGRIADRLPQYKFVLVGGTGKTTIPGVLCTGRIPYDQALNYYRTCSVMVIPSVWEEPNGLGIQEAGQFGKPLVAFDVGGISEYVEHDVIPLRDIDAAAELLDLLMGDPEERKKRGARNKERVLREFTATHMAKRYEALYERIAR